MAVVTVPACESALPVVLEQLQQCQSELTGSTWQHHNARATAAVRAKHFREGSRLVPTQHNMEKKNPQQQTPTLQ